MLMTNQRLYERMSQNIVYIHTLVINLEVKFTLSLRCFDILKHNRGGLNDLHVDEFVICVQNALEITQTITLNECVHVRFVDSLTKDTILRQVSDHLDYEVLIACCNQLVVLRQ